MYKRQVDGSVTDESGKPVADYLVIIVPEDGAALRRRAFRRIAVARPGPQGRFRAEHLAAGRYLAAAIADAPIEDLEDADFLESIRRVGKAFTVDEGASVTVDLKLTPVP